MKNFAIRLKRKIKSILFSPYTIQADVLGRRFWFYKGQNQMNNFGLRLKRKIKSIFFSPYTIRAEVLGEKFRFYIGTFEGSLWYGKDRDRLIRDVTPELEWTKSVLTPGDILVDAGAHHGYCALVYSRWVGKKGKVYSFECNPSNHAILLKNLELNGIENVVSVAQAVGDREGEVSITDDSSGIHLSLNSSSNVTVPIISLDQFFKNKGVTPTALKIDVEGYECEVLKGSQNILTNKPKLILEVHNFVHADPKPRLEMLFNIFSNYKQTFWQSCPGEPISPFSPTKKHLEIALKYPNPHFYVLP